MKPQGKQREKPRLSAAPLGKYHEATPAQRERILRKAKFPSTFIVAAYNEATVAIRRSFLAGGDTAECLRSEAMRIASLPGTTRNEQTAHANSARAVRALSHRIGTLPLKGVSAVQLGARDVTLVIEGVSVSIFPQVLLTRTRRDGSVEYGAMLVVMRKTEALGLRSGRVVAELLRRALVAMGLSDRGTIDPSLCMVVDVFHPGFFQAKGRGGKRIAQDLECACREIAARWPQIRAADAA